MNKYPLYVGLLILSVTFFVFGCGKNKETNSKARPTTEHNQNDGHDHSSHSKDDGHGH